MSVCRDIRPVTYMKTRAAELIEDVVTRRSPVVITQNGKPRAVVIDVDTYESWSKALLLLKLVAQGEADIAAGRVSSQADVFRRLRKRFPPRG